MRTTRWPLSKRRKADVRRPLRLGIQALEDRTVPAQIAALGPADLGVQYYGPGATARAGDTLYFLARQGMTGSEMWSTDGSAVTKLSADPSRSALSGLFVGQVVTAGDAVYFTASANDM